MKTSVLCGLFILLANCSQHRDLPVLGSVPGFELTSQQGKLFHGESLQNHVWIADFIFTHCPGPCLRMSSRMREIQRKTAGKPDIRLVSFSVDPARDTPAVLSEFAAKYQADPARWSFLTGKPETLQTLSRDVFKLGDVDGSMNHSTRLVLVDQRGRIRGYYGTTEENPVSRIAADALQLERENT